MLTHIKKRILPMFLAFAVILCCIPAAKVKADTPTYSHLTGAANVEKPSVGGKLQVLDKSGVKTLCDKNGNPIQLRGMCTHGLQWYPEIINDNAFAALSGDWGCNVIRLAMYVGEDGYATHSELKQKVIDGINLAIKNDMYVIVDWHVLTPGDPTAEVYSGAKAFFESIAELYPNNIHILYELCNEPNSNSPGVTNDAAGWETIKSYAAPIIKSLRDSGNSNSNIMIVGTPNWSQRPDLAADDPINDSNTLYSFHFYAGTHDTSNNDTDRSNVMSNVRYALGHGVGVICTEMGASEADGDHGPYLDKTDAWIDYLNANNISWCNWSLSNQGVTSAAFMPYVAGVSDGTSLDPGSGKVWTEDELTVSGEYMRARIKGIEYNPIDRTKKYFNKTAWDFNDGAAGGFAVNSDSPVTSVSVTSADGMLKLGGLAASSDTSGSGYWSNVRISADSASADHKIDIKGATSMSIDVYASAPATVAIAAIPQSASNGWANPVCAKKVLPSDFALQGNGSYKATITISDADSPNLQSIAESSSDSILTNLILFVGSNSDSISLDNITFSGTSDATVPVVKNDPLGTASLPSTFDDSTRQGWAWDSSSGVKGSLTIKEANGSKALSWDCEYPSTKPTDTWASAPRLILSGINATRGANKYLNFDFYINPARATTGNLDVFLAFAPPALSYWAQAADVTTIPLADLSKYQKTTDGLYKFTCSYNLDNLTNNKVIDSDTLLRDIIVIVADDNSDFSGKMYLDNVGFSTKLPSQNKVHSITGTALSGGSVTAAPATAEAGTKITVMATPENGYKLKAGSLKYTYGGISYAISGGNFIMPDADVTLSAEFVKANTGENSGGSSSQGSSGTSSSEGNSTDSSSTVGNPCTGSENGYPLAVLPALAAVLSAFAVIIRRKERRRS